MADIIQFKGEAEQSIERCLNHFNEGGFDQIVIVGIRSTDQSYSIITSSGISRLTTLGALDEAMQSIRDI